jgi:hypothetical protein
LFPEVRHVSHAPTVGVWRSPVARKFWVLQAAGSNPATPTSAAEHYLRLIRATEVAQFIAENSDARVSREFYPEDVNDEERQPHPKDTDGENRISDYTLHILDIPEPPYVRYTL